MRMKSTYPTGKEEGMKPKPLPLEEVEERYPPEHRVDLPRIERAVREVLAAVGEGSRPRRIEGHARAGSEGLRVPLRGAGD
jgi:hypothetical protein